jgi:uncharacterized alpha-E superfamily protein
MLLSRVANSLYWMGRYLERAENANRHLLVTSEFAVELEGINEEIASQEWLSLLASMTASKDGKVPESEEETLRYMASFLVDKDNPLSVLSSLGKARDNARSVGEIITFEITYNLNEAYRELGSVSKRSMRDPSYVQEALTQTHNSILTTLGAVEHTLTRGEGWNYMKLGEAIERTQRTLYVLRTRLPNLLSWGEHEDAPLYFASWRSLLRSLASLENYRQEQGPSFNADQVVRFLLFHGSTPRAVYCGVRRMLGYIRGMSDSGPGIRESRRLLGKLGAQLEFDQEEIMRPDGTLQFFDRALLSLNGVHDAISNPMGLR